jgi:hypothetical protein
MKIGYFAQLASSSLALLLIGPQPARHHYPGPPADFPVQVVVTVEPRHGGEPPVVSREDVMVYEGRERDQVTDWFPLQGEQARLQFFILLDDASRTSLGSQLDDVRQFILSQPPTTAVGVGYMSNGAVDVVQNFTTDHAEAARSVRLPRGIVGAFASPYLSLVDLIKRWPVKPALTEPVMNRWPGTPIRHEVLMITDGIDRFGGAGLLQDPHVDSAVEEAQTSGIIVFTLYASGVGHSGTSFWRINWGQNYLSELAEETGGEAFFLGYETPISFAPYLDQLSRRLNHQYLLAFIPKPQKKSGLRRVRVRTELPNAELIAAEKVFVPASE